MIEHDDGRCIFYDNGCEIYPARPVQCSTFPFWPPYMKTVSDFMHLVRNCPGYGQGEPLTEEEVQNITEEYYRELLFKDEE